MSTINYVHGYAEQELERLSGSAATLAEILHEDTQYPAGARVLEAGCGVGAQTRFLLRRCPGMELISMDIARLSLQRAHQCMGGRVPFVQADLHHVPFPPQSFDHIFVCYVLEHLPDPLHVLMLLKPLLKPGGMLTVIEGDHGSAFWHPETPESLLAWRVLPQLQQSKGGDGNIGRRLYDLLKASGAVAMEAKPLPVWCDPTRPDMMDGFVDKTIVGMLRGIEEEALQQRLIAPEIWRKGVQDLIALSQSDTGSFSYTFFRAVARYD
jgi:SAM-dependent methyltransferase